MNELLQTLALAYQYPTPGSTKALWERLEGLPHSQAKATFEGFLRTFSELTLAEREELHTRTLDLAPLTAPNIGYAVYGEDYRRGRFMAALSREYAALEVDTAGEIPDHLIPVLHYLAVAAEPLPELLQLLEPALGQIRHTLQTLEPKNLYLKLLEATQEALAPLAQASKSPTVLGSLVQNLPFWKGGKE
ncbi:MAG: nitrate reductase [Thermaceae bacterium]|nr:nitrate reductase [Thermaceae bacterium]